MGGLNLPEFLTKTRDDVRAAPFRVALRYEMAEKRDTMTEPTAMPPARTGTTDHRALIVLVDGDAHWRVSAECALRGGGYEVVACGSLAEVSREAFRLGISRPADLLVVDAALADPAACETAVAAHEPVRFRDCPMLVLAGSTDEEVVTRALEADAADFFIRSTHWQLLVERVRRLCRMTEMKRELLASQDRLARAHASARVGTFDFDLGSQVFRGSTGSFSVLGFDTPRTAIGVGEFLRLVPGDRHEALFAAATRAIRGDLPFSLELPLRKVGGDWLTVRVEAEPRRDATGRVAMLRGVIRDMTENLRIERDMERLISVDPLTGLPNRNRFLALCAEAFAEARLRGGQVALVAIDLDRFTQINESLGQVAGDEAICVIADRLGHELARLTAVCARGGDGESAVAAGVAPQVPAVARSAPVLARLPGDEFAIMVPAAFDPWDIDTLVEALLHALDRPLTIAGTECFVTACAGIALYPRDGDTAGLLLARADSALTDAKPRGSRSFRWYAPVPNVDARARLKMLSDLHKAIGRREISLSYQPCVDVLRGTLVGVEALARWRHDGVSIPPSEFIALAEQSGLIVQLGEWAIREASRQIRAWRDDGLHVPRVSVNISTQHFEKASLIETVREVIVAHRLEPGMLEIELTESCMVRDFARTLVPLQALRDLGVVLSLDDFGTAYSSLSYLTRLPIGKLKVDRSFVRLLGVSVEGEAVARAIVALGRSLRIEVVAEGVETVAQARALLGMKCHAMQGFLLARPVTADELPEAMARIPELARLASGCVPPVRGVRVGIAHHGVVQ